MKQCPNCKTTYTDDALRFCLADGGSLISMSEAPETVKMSFNNEPMRVNIPLNSTPTIFAPPLSQQSSPAKKSVLPIVIGVFGFLLLLVVGGIAAFVLLRSKNDRKAVVAADSPTPIISKSVSPTASPFATTNDETARLKEEMANLQKQLQEQKNQPKTTKNDPISTPKQTGNTARANSPRDGFLALRSEPNSETGYRITKIPHGATLTVLGCPKPSNIGKMPGRWCQVIYDGQTGWAFDAFMIF